MAITTAALDPDLWKTLSVDTLYLFFGGEFVPHSRLGSSSYHPDTEIPDTIVCRTSTSKKRLEKGLEAVKNQAVPGVGAIYDVKGGGSTVGVLFQIKPASFWSAHCTPDGAHLIRSTNLKDPIIKPLFDYKTFRAFLIGPANNNKSKHDLFITAKKRWFRVRNNPKSLGFSKDKSS